MDDWPGGRGDPDWAPHSPSGRRPAAGPSSTTVPPRGFRSVSAPMHRLAEPQPADEPIICQVSQALTWSGGLVHSCPLHQVPMRRREQAVDAMLQVHAVGQIERHVPADARTITRASVVQ